MWAGLFFFFYAPFPGAYNAPCTGFYIGGISVYHRPIAGLVGLYRGIVEGGYILGLVLVSPVPCSRSCCCACAFLLGIAEGLPLSLWLSSIGGGLAPCPGFIGVYFIDSGGGLCQ